MYLTVWKFMSFTTSKILREIKFGNLGCLKTAILAILKAKSARNYQFVNSDPLKSLKWQFLICTTKLPISISRKISVAQKSLKFHTVLCTQCGNFRNSLSHIFGKNFVNITVLLVLLKKLQTK